MLGEVSLDVAIVVFMLKLWLAARPFDGDTLWKRDVLVLSRMPRISAPVDMMESFVLRNSPDLLVMSANSFDA